MLTISFTDYDLFKTLCGKFPGFNTLSEEAWKFIVEEDDIDNFSIDNGDLESIEAQEYPSNDIDTVIAANGYDPDDPEQKETFIDSTDIVQLTKSTLIIPETDN